ncbi:MAG: oligosaccharide flippase family protein [bacterium]
MVARDSLVTLFTRLVTFSLAFAGNIILARLLGASGMGMWAVIISFLALVIHICGPGIAYANVYYVAQRKYTPGQVWAATLLTGIGFGSLAILTGTVLVLMKFRSLTTIQDKRLVLLALLSLPLMYISTWGGRIVQGMNRIGLMNLLDVISQVAYLVLMVLFVWVLRWGLWGAGIAYIGWHLSGVIALAIMLAVLMRPGEFRLSWEAIRSSVTYGLKMYVGKLSNWANNRVDLLIAPLFLQSAQIGQYAMAVAVTEKLWMFPDAMSQAVFPRISADDRGRPELTAQACRVALIVMLPIALLLTAIGWWLFPLLFGPEFQGSYMLMMAILPGTLAFGLSRILTTSLAGINRPATLSGVVAASAAVNIILNFLLIPWIGVVGCSLASTGSYSFEMLLLAFFYCRHHQVNPLSLLNISRSDFTLIFERGRRAFAHWF